MGAIMSANFSVTFRQVDSSYPYPNTIMEYLTDAGVEPRDYDMKVRPKKPFSWYSLMDTTNPKKKVQLPTTPGQSDKPAMVVAEVVEGPSTSTEPSSTVAAIHLPPSLVPITFLAIGSTSALKSVPMPAAPLSML